MKADLRGTLIASSLYAFANAIIRLVGGTRLAMDDAKTNLFAQSWAWGYQADNPPLYEWLIKSLHAVTGGGLWSFLVLNAVCLIAAAAFTHLTARRIAGERAAFGAACGLVLLYQVGWNYHQAFTHSALLLAMVCAGMWAGLRLTERQRWSDYVSFGVIVGLGMMAKYNFALFAAGFVGAAMTTRAGRRAVLSPWTLASVGVAAAIVTPHAFWLAERADAYAATVPDTLGMAGGWFARRGAGALSLLVAVVSFFVPWAFVYGWLRRGGALTSATSPLPREWPKSSICGEGTDLAQEGPHPKSTISTSPKGRGGDAIAATLLLRTSLIAAAVILLGILVFGIGAVSERYVIPVLLPAYAALTASLLTAKPRAFRPYLLASLAVAVLFSAVRFATFLYPGAPFCQDCRVATPYAALEAAVAETVPPNAILLAREENTAGNLAAAFPDARVTSLNLLRQYNPATTADAARPCYYVWSEDTVGGVPLFDVFAFAYDDPRTVMVDAAWRAPLRQTGFRRTVWGITPLDGVLYDRFCVAEAPG